MTRPGAIAAIAVVAALLGGTTALVLGKAVGWVDDDPGQVETVLLTAPDDGSASEAVQAAAAAKPLVGNGFDASEIYAKRASGVVTIYSVFGEEPDGSLSAAAQGSGFVVSDDGYILTNSHVITTAGEVAADEKPEAADAVYVEFRDGERVPATIVGWDLYDDVGLLKVDPGAHPVAPVPLGDSSTVVVGEPVAAIGSPFGQATSLSVGVVSATERSIASLTSRYSARRRDPDRRADQPRELRRPHVRRRRGRHRDQRPDPERVGQRRGRGLRGSHQRREAVHGAADPDRARPLCLAGRHDADDHAGDREEARVLQERGRGGGRGRGEPCGRGRVARR